MKIALDAMGGDDAPAAQVAGAVEAAREPGLEILLVGDQSVLERELAHYRGGGDRIEIVHAPSVVAMNEAPSLVVRRKRDSSIWVATRLVKEGRADAVVSAGNTGASMATAFFLFGTLAGVERPAIAALLPSLSGATILLDVGANVDCKPQQLCQFGIMGSIYAERVLGRRLPRVGLLSIGEEDEKGNELTREVFKLLRAAPLNFIGNVEGRDVYAGTADVIVCDGFIGNVALKISEGLAETIERFLRREIQSSFYARLAYLPMRPVFRAFRRHIDYAEYGGAPLLGVDGVCVICHGRSNGRAIMNAILTAQTFVRIELNRHIREGIAQLFRPGPAGAP